MCVTLSSIEVLWADEKPSERAAILDGWLGIYMVECASCAAVVRECALGAVIGIM